MDTSIPQGPPRSERALDAALQILGELGLKALTHARVDRAAELPAGSTSNYFRTRQALVEGVTSHLAQREREDFGQATPLLDRAAAQAAFTRLLERQSGPFSTRTLARYALFIDLVHSPELVAPLKDNRKTFENWTTATLAALGAKDPLDCTRFLMATLDGALLHRITVDEALDFGPIVRRALSACLDG
ncbi:TetR/AcrR family transcriptional regulator [Glutamicibacter protophormiae]|uniref:TetR/AcrR family transcriptional regulator n=1 Tax=Glutamicibacter protophormiae TaxID=37930 RepID=UPI00195BACE7|nr:TetR family transcriptional regulator [Glutamicibacter protophormiae]QRQ78823.1 TetR family transcriptional regulator [Glutamicibacter protophormiae]